jgi:predicted ABC-type sugar transport system permease subunit
LGWDYRLAVYCLPHFLLRQHAGNSNCRRTAGGFSAPRNAARSCDGSLQGGESSVVGTLIGAFIMGLLSNGSDLLGVSPYLQQAIIGAVIILAVKLDEPRKRRTTSA